MTIRTIDDFNKLPDNIVHAKYLPVSLAERMPKLVKELKLKFGTTKRCKSAVEKLNKELAKEENFVRGFYREKISDDTKTSLHQCKADYCENLRTYGEANSGINGKPSIGIQFVDADDGCNDYIWIATDVLTEANPIAIPEYAENAPLPKIGKGFRIVRKTKYKTEWYEVQKRNMFGFWKNAITVCGIFLNIPRHFSSFDAAFDAYMDNFSDVKTEVLTA